MTLKPTHQCSYMLEDIDDTVPISVLIDAGHELRFKCKHCGRQQRLDLRKLIIAHGPATTLRYIRKSVSCTCQ